MCPANLPNGSSERWIRDRSKLPACFDHHFSPPPPAVEVWFLVGPSWQILNKNNDANCKKKIYIYIPNLLNFILVGTCHLILCVFFRSFCQVIAAARQAGGLALERQAWDALPCRLGVVFRSRDWCTENRCTINVLYYIIYSCMCYISLKDLKFIKQFVDWLVCCEESQF